MRTRNAVFTCMMMILLALGFTVTTHGAIGNLVVQGGGNELFHVRAGEPTSSNGVAHTVIETFNGGYLAAGSLSVDSSINEESPQVDVWVVKTDKNGIEEWNRTYGGTEADVAESVIETADGGFLLAGYTESLGAGDRDMWLVKTDSSGSEEWDRTYGETEIDGAESVIETADGGFLLAGYTESLGAGDRDMWLVKTDSNGIVQWDRTYGGTEIDRAECVIATGDGGFLLAGSTQGVYTTLLIGLVKTDKNGNTQWIKSFGRSGGYHRAFSVIETSDNGYVLVGDADSLGSGSGDIWLIKTNSNGNVQWNQTFGVGRFDSAESVIETADGGFLLAGYTQITGASYMEGWVNTEGMVDQN
ncbi:MAG: hypothetical protein ACE5OZ_07710 [Candidatus Heimdallarchaeota archaeon]